MNKLAGCIASLLLLLCHCAKAQSAKDVLGEWMSPKKDTRIVVYQNNDRYYGKVVWGTGSATKDVQNPDPKLRNRDVVGLVILTGFKYDGDGEYTDGKIYDPREGKTYSCKMTLDGKGQLKIRGYIGISAFGRTEIWTKTN